MASSSSSNVVLASPGATLLGAITLAAAAAAADAPSPPSPRE
jgi:hypothetical protein